MKKLSIIIPSYNNGEDIIKLVNILKNRSKFISSEIIVVESGNNKYKNKLSKEIVFLKSKKGRDIQMNLAVRKSSGDFLLFINSNSSVSRLNLLDVFNKHSSRSCWFYFKIIFDSKKRYFRFIELTSNLRARIFEITFGDQGLLISKELFNKINGFNLGGYEDIDLSKKLKKICKPIRINQELIASPKRFLEHGPIKTHLVIGLIFITYLIGLRKTAKNLYKLIN